MSACRVVCTLSIALVTSTSSAFAQTCTSELGQAYINQGRYKQAVKEFTCLIDAAPTEVEGYRGRIEAQLMLGLYADAFADYARVTARVLPVHPDAASGILAGYDARLAADRQSVTALTGASFARWWLFQYAEATHLLNDLLDVQPANAYGNLFRGSSRLLRGATNAGVADLEYGIALDPSNPQVHAIAADAYTYGLFDPSRAFAEATQALDGGLDTPRVHAILAASYAAFGDVFAAAAHVDRHIDLVTTDLAATAPLPTKRSLTLAMVPGRTVEIPIAAGAGETIAVATSSKDYWDTIAVLLAPDGTPVVSSDDDNSYFAAIHWQATQTATYRFRVTFFESVNYGEILVVRK